MKHVAAVFVVALALFASASSLAQTESALLASLPAQWWQYAISVPSSVNPLTDAIGTNCMVGQRNPIWFLGGNFLQGGTVMRACTIPAGQWLFFPVINSVQINVPNVCGQGDSLNVEQLRALAATPIDAVTKLSVSVDGKGTTPVRIRSEVFATAIPEDNIFNLPYVCGPGAVPPGVYSPSVDDGYYVLLKPLSVGTHTLHFEAESGAFVLDVTYNLTITAVHRN